MKHIQIYEQFLNEAGGHWDGKGNWVEDKPAAEVKYHKGFDAFPCVKKQGWVNLDLDKDGIVEIIAPGGITGEKRYLPGGVVEWWKGKPSGGFDITKGKYSCNNGKVIDSFIANPKVWTTYKNNNPWVKKGLQEYIPYFTKDTDGQKEIQKLQQKLIDKGFLKIKKPTGNFGNMTKDAVKQAARKIMSSEETNIYDGITRQLYTLLMK